VVRHQRSNVDRDRAAGAGATGAAVPDAPLTGALVAAEDGPVDLAVPDGVRWSQIVVPAGWQPVADVARRVSADLPALTARVTSCVQKEIAAYRAGRVPLADLEGSVRANLRAIIVGLAEHRAPTRQELTVRRELGTRRALQGLPIDALIQAYHVGYRELWLALVGEVPDGDQQTATQLLTAATTVWQWVHEVTEAIAAAHAATVRTLEARAVGARQRFVELLAGGDLDGSEADRIGRSLGFDPDDRFTVLAIRGATDDLDAVVLQRELDPRPERHAVVARGPLVVVVCQGGIDPSGAIAAARVVFPAAAIGVGATRPGLRGARASLEDAERTLGVTYDGQVATFDEMWLWATLGGVAPRLEPLLRPGTELARSHPHLAEAVRAFAAAGFSATQAARDLSLHANTVTYRLDRWEALTGWDPRSFTGLARSLASLQGHVGDGA
jgi:hypothetical protein